MFMHRLITNPLPPTWEPNTHHYIEFHAEFVPYPIGVGFVSAFPQFAVIDLIEVVDEFAHLGIEIAIFEECERRWPGIGVTPRVVQQARAFELQVRRNSPGYAADPRRIFMS